MSDPDDLTRLKTVVEIYEKELQGTIMSVLKIGEGIDPKKIDRKVLFGFGIDVVLRIVNLNNKLLNAYREYVQELEKLIPS